MANRSNEWGNSIKKKVVPVVTEPPALPKKKEPSAPKKLSLVEGSGGNWAVADDNGIHENISAEVKPWPESWPSPDEEKIRARKKAIAEKERQAKEIKDALLNELLEVLEKAYDEKYGKKPGLLDKLFKKKEPQNQEPVIAKRKPDALELKHKVFDLMLWPDDSLYNGLRDSLFSEFQNYLKKAYDKGYNKGYFDGINSSPVTDIHFS